MSWKYPLILGGLLGLDVCCGLALWAFGFSRALAAVSGISLLGVFLPLFNDVAELRGARQERRLRTGDMPVTAAQLRGPAQRLCSRQQPAS